MNEVFVVERHDFNYEGPHRTALGADLQVAFELAAEMRDEHRGEEWQWKSSDYREALTWHPNTTGWVSIHKEVVHT